MTTVHKNDEIHISMLAERQEVLIKDDKLISSDGGTQKTKNIRLGDLQCKAICPFKVEKFIISEAQILASSYGNPIILLPTAGSQEFYTIMTPWMNTFKSVVTNPANPFVVAPGQQLLCTGYNTLTGITPAYQYFKPLEDSEFTNPTTQVSKFYRTQYFFQYAPNFQGTPTTNYSTVVIRPSAGTGLGWIAGEGYWEIELMYRLNNAN